MSLVGQRDSFISNDSSSAIFFNSPISNDFFCFHDASLATSSSAASNRTASSLHPPLKPVTYWNDRRQLETWK